MLRPRGPRLQPPRPILPQEELLWGLGAERGRCPRVRSFCLPREQLPALRGLVLPTALGSGTTTFPRGSFGVPDPAGPGGGSGAAGGPWAPLPVPPLVTRSLRCPAQPAPPPPSRQPKLTPCFALGTGREALKANDKS